MVIGTNISVTFNNNILGISPYTPNCNFYKGDKLVALIL